MRRLLPYLLAIATAALSFGGVALAQERPEFKLGFAALAAQIPEVVGAPLEAEHYGPNGDSLQQTSMGLMVWRKADNWTAFTDGARSWVNGPDGVQERGNDERFEWEARAVPSPATPTPTPTPAATPIATASPTPSPTPAPAPNLRSSDPHVIQGQGLEAGSVWVLGELRNEGSTPAYNARVTARLLTASGEVAGTANQLFVFLGAGDTVGYRIEVRNPSAYERVEVTTAASGSGFADFTALPIAWVKNEKIADGQSDIRYEFTGTLNNGGDRSVSLSTVYVWFLDDQDRVVWMDSSYAPNTLAPGDSYSFTVRTIRDGANPEVSAISEVRYYAAGQLR